MNALATMPNIQFERGLPASVDAERSVLGSIVLTNTLFYEAADTLQIEDFALDQHRRIFACMADLLEDGKAIDLITLAEVLKNNKDLQTVGGLSYLCSLTENMPRRPSLEDYADIVAEKALLRRAISICSDGITRCADQSEDAEQVCASIENSLMSTRSALRGTTLLDQKSDEEWLQLEQEASGEKKKFYSTGILGLDRRCGGVARGEMTICAGWPGQGKTSSVVQLAVRHCSAGTPMLVISPEMTQGQFLRRVWAEVAGVPFRILRRPENMSGTQREALEEARARVKKWPLYVDEAQGVTAHQAAARARLHKMRHGVEIVAIDYLQKLKFSSKPSERFIEVGDAAVTFSNLAKYEDLAVLVLSSLTEPAGKSRGTQPSLGDLRMSGDIQYEASTVWLIHRPIHRETNEVECDGDIIIAKGRSDGSGTIPIHFNSNFLTFEDRIVR